MKNKIGIIISFLAGSIGFLILFKVLVLNRLPPEDELAPGMVVILAVVTGIGCALVGKWIQTKFQSKKVN